MSLMNQELEIVPVFLLTSLKKLHIVVKSLWFEIHHAAGNPSPNSLLGCHGLKMGLAFVFLFSP